MSEVPSKATAAALSRAKNTYIFAGLLLVAFWFMSLRAGYRLDQAIPEQTRTLIRIGELVLVVVGMVASGLIGQRRMARRAAALGEAEATEEVVAEDYVKAKTLVAILLGAAAFLGLLMVLADDWGGDWLLLGFPLALMFLSFPNSGGLKTFVGQINALRDAQQSSADS